MFSDEVAVALAPARTYARLVGRRAPVNGWRAVERPALVLVVIGTSLAIAATTRVTATLVASAMLTASFTIIVQLIAAALLVASRRARPVTTATAIDLLFAGHAPWSLWVLVTSLWAGTDLFFSLRIMGVTMLVPLVWTVVVMRAFCLEVLETTPRGASLRTLAHQAVIWGFGVSYVAFASGGWFRLLDP
jgi:hypothetical protein